MLLCEMKLIMVQLVISRESLGSKCFSTSKGGGSGTYTLVSLKFTVSHAPVYVVFIGLPSLQFNVHMN